MEIEQIRKDLALRQMERIYPRREKNAAVLIPLIETKDGLHVLFEIRGSHVRQGGEVCFPGGRIEPGEKSMETAVRETAEELLLDEDQIEVIAPMHAIMMGPRGAQIQSYLGTIRDYRGTFSSAEVERVFTVPLKWFAMHEPRIVEGRMVPALPEDFPFDLIPGGVSYPWSGVPKHYYFWEYRENDRESGTQKTTVIWGITAEVLYHCLEVLGICG